MPQILLNGERINLESEISIAEFLVHIGLQSAGTAVAVGGDVIRRAEFATRLLIDGDEVEIIRAIGGG